MLDIIVRNGKLVDGGGKNPPVSGDVGVKNGEIIEIGNLEQEVANVEIDAGGRLVVPGFIDINNHSDTHWTLFKYPDQESLVMQGITTIIGGNCGSSLAPILGEGSIKSLRKWVDLRDVQIDWERMGEFLDFLEDNRPLRINFGTLVGHATLRRGLIGDEIRPLDESEIKIISHQLGAAMHEGAWGLSTGLAYTHNRVASVEEIVDLANVVKYHQGVFAVHPRGEREDLVSAVREVTDLSRKTNVNLEISHLKAVGKKAWHLFERALGMIREAVDHGANINYDVYPYTSSGPVLYTLLPNWATDGGRENLLKMLRDGATRRKVVQEIKNNSLNYSQIIVASSPLSQLLVNKSIAEIARVRETSPEEVVVDLALASGDQCTVIMKLLAENNVTAALAEREAIVVSDGVGYSKEEEYSGGLVHPRCFGAFPRFLSHYVKEKRILNLPRAIHKMTGLPAQKIGLPKRGRLKVGYKADIVVLNWDRIADTATIRLPYRYPIGIDYVIVNGEVTVAKEKLVPDVRSGQILRKK
jgi:N-acyl-D-amino-acid deacylase